VSWFIVTLNVSCQRQESSHRAKIRNTSSVRKGLDQLSGDISVKNVIRGCLNPPGLCVWRGRL